MRVFNTNKVEETLKLAKKLGNLINKGSVILLDGDLGAGKTTFTKGLAEALGIKKNISSPTFTILKTYFINENYTFNHLDLYRLDNALSDFDLKEYIDDRLSTTVIEWPFNVADFLPNEYLLITIKYIDETKREFIFEPIGEYYERVVSQL